jgi:valyl-tRNA synthetase
MATEAAEADAGGPAELSLADRWIAARLAAAARAVREGFAAYRLDLAAQAAYEFTWYEFCDWYLELSKVVLQSSSAGEAAKRGTRRTLLGTLEGLLRLLHPLMPFITEEIWGRVAPRAGVAGETIMRAPFPAAEGGAQPGVEDEMRWVMDFILGVRRIRGEMDIAPSVRFDVLLQDASPADLDRAARHGGYLERLANVSPPRALVAGESPPPAAAALHGTMKILVPMAGIIDLAAETARLGKRRGKLEQELAKAQGKLGNANFVQNAPAAVVEQEQARVAQFKRELEQVAVQLERLASLG